MTPNLVRAIETLTATLDASDVDYVIGGAIALAFWSTPRATLDIDITVDIDALGMPELIRALREAGVELNEDQVLRAADRGDFGARLFGVRLDIFLPELPLVCAALTRKQRVPFGQTHIFIMSLEDVLLLKVMFGRTKDFADLENLLAAKVRALDVAYVDRWLDDMFARDDARLLRYRDLFSRALAAVS